MRRLAPRPLSHALEAIAREAAPAGLLARVQGLWSQVAGDVVAAESEPVSEHEGVVTVRCSAAVWAHELELLAPDLCAGLNASLAPEHELAGLRFTTAHPPARNAAAGDL